MHKKVECFVIVVAVLLIGAAAVSQITRAEFNKLQARVKTLEAHTTVLRRQVKSLTDPKAGAAARKPTATSRRPSAWESAKDEASKAEPLQGTDLDAWKLARENLMGKIWNWDTSNLSGEATSGYMRRSATGDYEFLFWLSARPKGQPQPRSNLPRQRFITVVDMGMELRVRNANGSRTPADPKAWPRKQITCPTCGGKGYVKGPVVGGTTTYIAGLPATSGGHPTKKRCSRCKGIGRIWQYGENF